MKQTLKNSKGITLIALVITIIVLLILAGVSIATLTGENGILTQATEASKKSEIAETKEQGKLDVMAWQSEKLEKGQDATLTDVLVKGILQTKGTSYAKDLGETSFKTIKNGYEILYSELYKNPEGTTGGEINLPSTSETSPFLPDDKSTILDDSTLETGLVVKDKNENEWVWIEVPKSITKDKTTDTEIETTLQTYATDYRKTEWTDTWYEGCGLTEIEYNTNKSKMLQRIKNNGGFWIGRYEVGTDTQRKEVSDTLTTPLIKQDKYVYNNIIVSQAQSLSNELNPNNTKYISGLMYGIQWDLVLKYLEEKATQLGSTNTERQSKLKTDSSSWANSRNVTFDIARGKYSIDNGKTYTDVTTVYTKPIYNTVLLTTGASERNKVLNIYDLAGNEWEWTLEKNIDSIRFCSFRGGIYSASVSLR